MPNRPHHRLNTLVYHKPGCPCPPCTRKAKALAGGPGAGGPAVETAAPSDGDVTPSELPTIPVVHVDGLPPIIAQDRGARSRVMQIVQLRARGLNYVEIGKEMDLTAGTVRGYMYKAAKEGWLIYENPIERFQQEIVPHVVDNIAYWVKKKDKQMTIEAAKGAGIFTSHQAVRVEGDAPQTLLSLKIEPAPQAGDDARVITGHIVGQPRQLRASNGSEG